LVIEPGRSYRQLGENQLEPFSSTPAFQGGRIYIRARKHLYAIGE